MMDSLIGERLAFEQVDRFTRMERTRGGNSAAYDGSEGDCSKGDR